MRTHERTHQTMWRAAKIIAVGCLLYVLVGCTSPPTGPTPPELTHPNEILLNELVQCNADYHGLGHLDIAFFDACRPTVAPDGKVGCSDGGAWPYANWVEFWHSWVLDPRRTRNDLADIAAHEVCHASGIWGEAEIPACRDAAMKECS